MPMPTVSEVEDSQALIQLVVGEAGAVEVIVFAIEEAEVEVAAIEDIDESDA